MITALPWRIAQEVGESVALARGWAPLRAATAVSGVVERGVYAVLGPQQRALTAVEVGTGFQVRAGDVDPLVAVAEAIADQPLIIFPPLDVVSAVLATLTCHERVRLASYGNRHEERLWWLA